MPTKIEIPANDSLVTEGVEAGLPKVFALAEVAKMLVKLCSAPSDFVLIDGKPCRPEALEVEFDPDMGTITVSLAGG